MITDATPIPKTDNKLSYDPIGTHLISKRRLDNACMSILISQTWQ